MLRRNPFYRGGRPHHVDRFIVDMQAASPGQVLDQIERNQADWGWVPPPFYHDPARGLARKYGGSRYFLAPGWALGGYLLNSHRPLFRNNPSLRRAVNFAVDRTALLRGRTGRAADQLVPRGIPGFRDAAYGSAGPPRRAKGTFSGQWNIRAAAPPFCTRSTCQTSVRAGRSLVNNLEKIGLKVDLKTFPPLAYFDQIDNPRAAFDIAGFDWLPDYIDPYQYTNLFFDGRHHGGRSLSRFDSPRYNRLMRRAARLQGQARYQAYADLDLRLSRGAAPFLTIGYWSEPRSSPIGSAASTLAPTLISPPSARSSYGDCTLTHTLPAPTTIPAGAFPTSIVFTTSRLTGSIRETVPPPFATQIASGDTARAFGLSPTSIVSL